MAVGVPETDVLAAADAVLARGERPTVERVRAELGRGSPARVGQLLEHWWEQLAKRLKGHALLPELPGEIAQAFAEAWRLALIHAGTAAETALTEQQNTLFAAQTALAQERKLWEIGLAEAQVNAAEAQARLTQAEAQLRERQTLIDQLVSQVADVRQQRDHLQAKAERLGVQMDELRAEREATEAHVRTAEDRAHQQADQLRQDLKTLQQRREKELRDHDKRATQLAGREQVLQEALRTAEQTVAHHLGRVAALETTIATWRSGAAPTTRRKRKTTKSGPATTTSPTRSASKRS